MKRIGLTGRIEENQFEQRECFDLLWGKLLRELGYLPIFIPMESDYGALISEFELDGIILSGGNDLNSLNPNALSKRRDTFEKELISIAINTVQVTFNSPTFCIRHSSV